MDAVELTPEYVKQMQERFAGNGHIRVYEGNAKDLSFLDDNVYDLVLLMGPIYSIKDFEDRKRACKEALRIAKPGAPVFIAFCLQDAPLVHEIFMAKDPAHELTQVGYDRERAIVTDNTGSSRLLDTIAVVDELIDTVCAEYDARKVCRFAQDGLSEVIRSSVNTMSEEAYAEWIQYLIATAERADLMGYSDHVVQIIELQ